MHTKEDTRVDPCPVEPLSVEAPELPRGAMVDRFFVLEKLGAGGMGVVYAAYDPELDRKVALKLLLPRSGGAGDGDRTRLVREAQALAKLSHPNVVAVHDVGTRGDRVWIAMEFVAGQTLTAWAKERPRRWSEVLALLADTARGLAAAHGAGLVHRDIKPDNVMIGSDGRVRVMDFGLAHGRAAAMTEPELTSTLVSGDHSGPELAALALRLTAVGAVQGTPAYMAPEQWLGLEEEAATDQFAWSVMAWELLFGERPFAAETTVALAEAVLSGQRRPPPSGRSVPGWLRRTLERGLATEPSRRWPTMAALLSALERGKTRARLRTAAAALAGVALLGLCAEGYRRWDIAERVAICEATGAVIDQVWNDDARRRLRDAFLATEVSYAATSAEKIMPWLDNRVAEWKQARTDVCLNADVRGVWSENLEDRATWCIEDRQMDIESIVAELVRADKTVVQKAVTAVSSLKTVNDCLESDMLLRQPSPPAERRKEIRDVRVMLSRALSLQLAGKYKDALKNAVQAREQADVLDWPPLLAAALVVEGKQLEKTGALKEAETVLRKAYFVAARSGAWDAASKSAVFLIYNVGSLQARHVDGIEWARHAELVLAHAGDHMGLREAGRLSNLATVHLAKGAYSEARALQERVLVIQEQELGLDHPDVASTLNNLGLVLLNTGATTEAREMLQRALTIKEQVLGRDHPSVAGTLENLVSAYSEIGAYAEARVLGERALSIKQQAYGPSHPEVAGTFIILATVYRNKGLYTDALVLYDRALSIKEKALGPDHPDVATILNNVANIHNISGEHAKARVLLERALAVWERAFGPNHTGVATALHNLATTHLYAGSYVQARAYNVRALAIREQALGANHADVAKSLSNLAEVYLEEKQPDEALRLLERAVVIYAANEGVQEGEMTAYFNLARALVDTGGDRDRALAEARRARDGLREAGAGRTKALAIVEKWLAEHTQQLTTQATIQPRSGTTHDRR